jgi:Rrf2 family protein
MTKILHMSEAASLAIHTMAYLAVEPEKLSSTHEIAEKLKVSEAHLAKVMQRLSRVGLVKSVRGPGGGFQITRSSNEIILLEIFEAIDGPLNLCECLLEDSDCCHDGCIFGNLLESVGKQVHEYLLKTTLDQIAKWRW